MGVKASFMSHCGFVLLPIGIILRVVLLPIGWILCSFAGFYCLRFDIACPKFVIFLKRMLLI